LVERNETELQKANQNSFTRAKGAACLATDPAITPSMAIAISN
jgi:hypothetical protein